MTIRSESQFILNLLKSLLQTPFYLIMSLFNPDYFEKALKPAGEVFRFLYEAKVTFYLVLLNVMAFVIEVFFVSEKFLLGVVNGQMGLDPMSIFYSWFLHAGVGHLFGNILVLFIFGRVIERKFGVGQYLMIYFGSALLASLLSLLFHQPGIGASGAISGVVSTAILVNPFYITYIMIMPLPILLIGWLAIIADVTGILLPVAGDNVGHFAHLGGYLAISLLVFMLSQEKKEKMKKGLIINVVFVVLLLLFKYLNIIKL